MGMRAARKFCPLCDRIRAYSVPDLFRCSNESCILYEFPINDRTLDVIHRKADKLTDKNARVTVKDDSVLVRTSDIDSKLSSLLHKERGNRTLFLRSVSLIPSPSDELVLDLDFKFDEKVEEAEACEEAAKSAKSAKSAKTAKTAKSVGFGLDQVIDDTKIEVIKKRGKKGKPTRSCIPDHAEG